MAYKALKALSVRPGWAHAIIHLGKDIENRSWRVPYRGLLLIQAGVTFATRDLDELRFIANKLGKPMPKREQIQAGGIVGVADVIDMVSESKSPWFEGPYGWVLNRVRPVPFLPCTGRLRLFGFEVPEEWLRKAGI